jgi:MFS family permease
MISIRRPITILVLLTGLNLLNYVDRFVLSAVLPRVQQSLDVSTEVAGWFATIFLIGYFATAPIFGAMADRGARKGLIAMGVAVWSAATFGSGLATGVLALMAARAFVGVGEASYATLAPTIIDDMSPPDRKSRWLSVFYVAIPIGSALGYVIGGFVEKHWGWRHAFYVAGGPGIVLAGLCLLIKEPERKLSKEKFDPVAAFKALSPVRLYRRGVLGYCALTFAMGGFAYWAPTYLEMRYALDLAVANYTFGMITVLAGAVGTVFGGGWADRWARRISGGTPSDTQISLVNMRVCAIGAAVAAPLAFGCFVAPTPKIFFVCTFFCELFIFLPTSPINAVILRSVPAEMRASAMALSIFAIHILGDLWSPPLIGSLLKRLPLPQEAMMAIPVAIAVCAITWWTRLAEAKSAVAERAA